ncbi:MAG: Asp-tRNA(Asn)/Glu-tRNA(Gln) amidotransferase subunit GatC [Acetobacteraceae bacterium]
MSLDTESVMRIAKMARIGLTPQECAEVGSELDHILGWVEQLKNVDVSNVPPMTGAGVATLRMRQDKVALENDGEDVLGNAPLRRGPFYAVPKVVE